MAEGQPQPSPDLSAVTTMTEELKLDPKLEEVWTKYTEENEEKFFRKYVQDFAASWDQQIGPSWELFVSSKLEGRRMVGPPLNALPDELLPALSKFLFVAKDEAEQGLISVKTVTELSNLVAALTILTTRLDNVALVGSMAFVTQLTQTVTLLLQHLLQMESSFFQQPARKVLRLIFFPFILSAVCY